MIIIAHAAAAILLILGIIMELICCLGVLLARRALDRVHYLSPASIWGPLLIAAAVIVYHCPAQAEIKAVLVALVLILTGPFVSYATGRAIVDDSEPTENES